MATGPRSTKASFRALDASKPTTALPIGSWSAIGRNALGCTGGFNGFGSITIHPILNQAGMYGWGVAHHSNSLAKRVGAIMGATDFQMNPGEQGRATALQAGISCNALSSCSSVNGRPKSGQGDTGKVAGPCHVSLTKRFSKAASSTGVAIWP